MGREWQSLVTGNCWGVVRLIFNSAIPFTSLPVPDSHPRSLVLGLQTTPRGIPLNRSASVRDASLVGDITYFIILRLPSFVHLEELYSRCSTNPVCVSFDVP